jgi:hypothetical protein
LILEAKLFWFEADAFPVSDLVHKNVIVMLSKAHLPANKDIAMELRRVGNSTYLRGWVAGFLLLIREPIIK